MRDQEFHHALYNLPSVGPSETSGNSLQNRAKAYSLYTAICDLHLFNVEAIILQATPFAKAAVRDECAQRIVKQLEDGHSGVSRFLPLASVCKYEARWLRDQVNSEVLDDGRVCLKWDQLEYIWH